MPLSSDFKKELKSRIDHMDMFNDYDPNTAHEHKNSARFNRNHEHQLGKFFRGEGPHTFLMVADDE